MTDNEIIKALECCANCESCDFETTNCPLVEEMECRSLLAQKALDLIHRQQAENDTLKNVIRKSFLEKAGCNIDPLAEIKSEAYKEFADRLKELDGYDNHTFDDCVSSLLVSDAYIKGRYEKINEIWNTIDNLLKEMTDNKND